jgi:signal transduction histidine kinase
MNEKLRVVGRLSRHDVRNKLSAVVGNAYLTKKKLPANSEVLNYVAEIEKAVQQAVRIFDFARAYEMLGAEELAYVGAEKTINEAVSLFSDENNAKVTNECHGLQLLADSLLRELFYNLIDNSLKYGKKTSQIRIFYEKSEDQLELVYEDDGVGITPEEKLNLFKEGIGKGTGYGLYLIKKMMEVYGWTIQETGQPGQGARFLITIPAINEKGKANYKLD